MTITVVCFKGDGDRVVQALQEAQEKLDNADGEVLLDFSGVRRVDPNALRAMEEFTGAAEARSVKVTLCGVNVDIYKVLKLARLSSRFSMVN